MIEMIPLIGKPAPWLTNTHRSEAAEAIRELCLGQPRRRIVEGYPQETERYSADDLAAMGMVGLYETEPAKPSR